MTAATVRHGDAYDLLPRLDAASVDLLVTSPPYWGHRTYGQSHNWNIHKDWLGTGASKSDMPDYAWYRSHGGALGLEPLPEWYVAHLVEMFELFRSALKATGSLWINLGDTYFARWASIRQKGRQGLGDKARERRRVLLSGKANAHDPRPFRDRDAGAPLDPAQRSHLAQAEHSSAPREGPSAPEP